MLSQEFEGIVMPTLAEALKCVHPLFPYCKKNPGRVVARVIDRLS